MVAVIEKMIKQRRESIAQFEQAARQDLADAEKVEIAVLSAYLPQQLGDAELDQAVAAAIAESGAAGVKDMGKVMALLKPRLAGGRHGQGLQPRQDQAFGTEFLSQNRGAMIPDSFKQDLLNRVDIVDVVGRYVQLKKGGANYAGLLPLPQREDAFVHGQPGQAVLPLLRLRRARQRHRLPHGVRRPGLRRCGEGPGGLGRHAGARVAPRSARQEAARKEREPDLYAVMEKAMEFYRAELKKSPRAIDYLKGRGLTGEIAARFGIGYAPDDWQGLKTVFPDYRRQVSGRVRPGHR